MKHCVCVCVCVFIRVSAEVSLRCTCSHFVGLGSCRLRLVPPSLIVSCTRISAFACANLSNNMCPRSPTMVPSLRDLSALLEPAQLAGLQLLFLQWFCVESWSREREEDRRGNRGIWSPLRVGSGFFFVVFLLLCEQRKLIWLVARWLLPVPERLRRRRRRRLGAEALTALTTLHQLLLANFCELTVLLFFMNEWKIAASAATALPWLLLLAEVIN